ncbi:30S ribosomal protein S17e [Candidatus Micrarchaeota archaeon]|nr:30S ribosomal protein S17e [Candidatus Micrarchaeota archaeon]
MGRIKGKHVKTAAKELVKHASDKFAADFDHNKVRLKELGMLKGNRMERNKLAGQITKLKRNELEEKAREEAEAA